MQGGDGLDGVGAADVLDAGFGEAEVLDLAGGDEVLDGSGYVFDGDIGVDAVLVEEVDGVGPIDSRASLAARGRIIIRDKCRPTRNACRPQ